MNTPYPAGTPVRITSDDWQHDHLAVIVSAPVNPDGGYYSVATIVGGCEFQAHELRALPAIGRVQTVDPGLIVDHARARLNALVGRDCDAPRDVASDVLSLLFDFGAAQHMRAAASTHALYARPRVAA